MLAFPGKYHTFTQSLLYLGTILVSNGYWGHTLDGSSHQHAGAEPSAAKRGYELESLLLEHRCGAVCGLVSEGAGFPASDWVGFDQAAALFSYGFESGFQCSARYALFAIFLENNKTSDSPKLVCAGFGGVRAILAAVVDARKLVLGPVLAPAYRFTVGIDKDSVGASAVEEFLLFPAIPNSSLGAGMQPFVLGECTRSMKMHALAGVPAVSLREEFLKVRPSLFGQLLGRVCRKLGCHDARSTASKSFALCRLGGQQERFRVRTATADFE